jgi:hypothetical protein
MSVAARSRGAADRVVPLLRRELKICSVGDFGCAVGTWLAAWHDAGVTDLLGIDGGYVPASNLQFPRELFLARDLSLPIELGRRFDLVESLEVAEHLPTSAAAGFIDALTRHADIVLFSASPPGQGGENHVNEQPYEYWRDLFAQHGYGMFDWIRPLISERFEIPYWYRYNLFLFVHARRIGTLPRTIADSAIGDGSPVPDLSPGLFRLRKQILRRVPQPVQNRLSRMMSRCGLAR